MAYCCMRHTHHAAYMQPHIHSYIAHVCAYGAVFNSAPRCAIYSYGPELLAKKLRNVAGIGVEEEEELPGVAGPPGVARGAWPACWAMSMAIKAAAASTFYLGLGDGQPDRHSTVRGRVFGSGRCLALELCHKVQ